MAYQSLDLAMNPRLPSYLALLSEEIIFKICEHLGLYELLQIGENDMNYQRIIGERIIANKRALDMTEIRKHYDVRAAFKQLGEFATVLCVAESSIQYKDNKYTFMQEILRLINKRCTFGQLRSVKIVLDKKFDEPIFRDGDAIPHVFENIHSLSVSNTNYAYMRYARNDAEHFVTMLIRKCLKLRDLHLKGIDGHGIYLLGSNLWNLTSLKLDNCKISEIKWQHFTQIGLPNLKLLKMDNCEILDTNSTQPPRPVEATTFPRLEEFACTNWGRPTNSKMIDLILSKSLKWRKLHLCRVKGDAHYLLRSNLQSLDSLSLDNCEISWITWQQFTGIGIPHLKSLKLEFGSYFNLADTNQHIQLIVAAFPHLEEFSSNQWSESFWAGYSALENAQALKNLSIRYSPPPGIFDALAKKNTVEKLRIGCRNLTESYPRIQRLTNLRTVSLENVSDANIPMITELMKLPLLTECSLDYYSTENLVSAIVKSSPHLQILKLQSFWSITAQFYKSIATARQMLFPNRPLHLYARFNKAVDKRPLPSIVIHNQ